MSQDKFDKQKEQKQQQKRELKKELEADKARVLDIYQSRKNFEGVQHKDIIAFKKFIFSAELNIVMISSVVCIVLAIAMMKYYSFIYVAATIAAAWYFIHQNFAFWQIELMNFKPPKRELRLVLEGHSDPLNAIIASIFAYLIAYFIFIHNVDFNNASILIDFFEINANQIKSLVMNITLIAINAAAMFVYAFLKSKGDGIDVYEKFIARKSDANVGNEETKKTESWETK